MKKFGERDHAGHQRGRVQGVKEAKKKADVLCGVARADAEKTRTAVREQTLSQQKELRQSAGANSARVAEEIRKIVLGKA